MNENCHIKSKWAALTSKDWVCSYSVETKRGIADAVITSVSNCSFAGFVCIVQVIGEIVSIG